MLIGVETKMKNAILILALVAMSSCGQIKRIMDGTENLPNQIQETNKGMGKTNEAIRLQKIGESLKMLKDPANRANLVPIPFDMMSPAKILSESLTEEEAVLFFKNYIIKLNKQSSADQVPVVDEEIFQHNRMADYYMLMLIAGFLPDDTVKKMVETESKQGAYQEVMLNILKLRVDFNSDLMVLMAILGLDPNQKDDKGNYAVIDEKAKLDTIGKIEKAMEYNKKVDYVCNLDFADKVDIQIEGFKLSPLDKTKAKSNWELLYKRAQSDFKATSFSKDPAANEQQVKEYTARYNSLLDQLQKKMEGKSE